ncbi:hypothetical protein E3N88_32793 [Mikania micrantha]|uniref:Uncharacterized protein n=1 Tax=Mikania micrantha TaxID=192012 RepID=A0A5N6MA60_9ASTR|nr:hypothetical protein E3N88_32793 [Mikania micrantha]
MNTIITITLIILMALVINLCATPIVDDDEEFVPSSAGSLRGASRFLAQHYSRGLVKCNKNPRLCRAKGSPGPDCCKKKCVNIRDIVEGATKDARKGIHACMGCAAMLKRQKMFV